MLFSIRPKSPVKLSFLVQIKDKGLFGFLNFRIVVKKYSKNSIFLKKTLFLHELDYYMTLRFKKRKYIFILITFCFLFNSYGQNNDTIIQSDRINKLIKEAKNSSDTITTFKLCRKIIALANTSKSQTLITNSYLQISDLYETHREYEKAKKLLLKGLKFSTQKKDVDNIFQTRYKLAGIERELMNFESAVDYALSSLDYCDSLNLMTEKANLLYIVSEVYYYKKLFEPSRKYCDKAKYIYTSINDSTGLFHVENQYGLLKYVQGNIDSAFSYFNKASEIANSSNYENGMAISFGNLATINFELGHYDHYMENMNKSMAILKKINKLDKLATGYNNIGYFYFFKGQYSKAVKNLLQSVQLAKKTNYDVRLIQAYGNLGEVYDALKDYKKAYVYRDSAANLEKITNELNAKKVLAEMTGKYELEKKELQLENLRKENSLKKAEIEKSEMQRKNQIIIIKFFIVFILVVLVLLFFLYRSYRQKNFINNRLKTQNIQIGLQNKQLINANEEIENQSEELKQLNENVSKQNVSLNKSIDELKKTQSQLIQSEKMASLGVLAAGVGHEINNPLNFIKGGIDLMQLFLEKKDKTLINETKQYTEIIYEGISRASAIVKSLSLFSRQTTSMSEECNIHNIIDNCLTILHTKTKNKIDIVKNYHKTPIILTGNTGKLHQVFINILSNSEQAIEENGIISIKTDIIPGFYEITISDTGSGIDIESLSKIGDPFFTTKDPGIGTGLGLSIAYSIIKEHRGYIKVNSELNDGTTFIISLPKT